MNITELRDFFRPYYAKENPSCRLDHAERLYRLTVAWPQDGSSENIDRDLVTVLAWLHPIRGQLAKHHSRRVAVEGFFVEHGWGSARIRTTLNAAQTLRDRPKTREERVVADAATVLELGLLGLARVFVDGGARGDSMASILKQAQSTLYRRAYTRHGQELIDAEKERMRAYILELRDSLETP